MAHTHDLIVIGGGPGGYVAAIRAAQLGMKTALVEAADLGGVCLNWGCIPTKALLRSAEVLTLARHAGDFGVRVGEVSYDLPAMVKRSRDIAGQLSKGIKHLLKKNKVDVHMGRGAWAGQGRVTVTPKKGATAELSAPHVLLATGARARVLPGLEPDGAHIWTAREAMTPAALPKTLLIVGAGAIGIEFASFYNALGSKVHVVEMAGRILPAEDAEISEIARKAFEKQGISITVNTKVQAYAKGTATLSDGQTIKAEKVIVAAGVVGGADGLGLDGTGAKLDTNGFIETGPFGATGEPGLYAIGDATAGPWLAHKASHEGVACVEKIAGLAPHALDKTRIPGCTYSSPQIASVGLTEDAAKAAGRAVKVGRFPFLANGKALALGEPDGLVKTLFDAHTGELLGAHMVGAEVTEMIQGFVVAMGLETTEAELMATVFPHPTLSEMMHEAVLSAYGRAVHI